MKIAILASGRGTNARAILERRHIAYPEAEFPLLISDNPEAPALSIARDFGVNPVFLDAGRKGARFSPDGAKLYIETLKSAGADLLVLAGFMRILPPEFVSAFDNRIVNLHPSLLPSFKGKDAIKQAFDFGVKICGCTVHFVDNQLDGGKIIAQKAVDIRDDDTLDLLESRVHDAEHVLLPDVISDIVSGKIKIG